MHSFIVNASLQIVPVVQDRHPYLWVDEAISIIQQSGIKHEVGPFATIIEGTYEEVFSVVHQVNNFLEEKKCNEWIMNLQVQLRSEADITAGEKTKKFN